MCQNLCIWVKEKMSLFPLPTKKKCLPVLKEGRKKFYLKKSYKCVRILCFGVKKKVSLFPLPTKETVN